MGGGVLGFSKSGMSSRTRGGQSRLLGRHGGRQGRLYVGDVKKFGDVRIRGERCVILPLEIGGREILLLKINPSPSYVSPYELRAKELDPLSLEEAFELFCRGVADYGPFWDHRLAEFVGQPFSAEEESEGVVDQIIKLCSFQHLSSLVIKKTAQLQEPNASSLKFVVNKRFWVDIWLNFNAYEVNFVVNY
ncbi:unnamed protein product [Malus baccata var. baccata]